MTSLQERLLSIEDQFLSALCDGGDALSTFEQRWGKLQEDLDIASRSGELDTAMSMLAHSTASRIATLADTSIELLIRKDTITDQLVEEVESLVAQIDLAGAATLTTPATFSSPALHLKRSCDDDAMTVPFPKRRRASSHGISSSDTPGPSKLRRFRSEPRGSDRQAPVSSPMGEGRSRPAATLLPTSQPSSSSKASLGQTSQATRKRRRSDAELCSDHGPRKKSHVGPRLHAVSDSFIPCMDPNAQPFPRRAIQTDPLSSPRPPSPSFESASNQLSLLQGYPVPIIDIHQEFEIDSFFASDPPSFTHLDDFLNTFVDVNLETPATHNTSSDAMKLLPRKDSSEELPFHLFNVPDSPLSSSSVSSSPISTPSYPLTPRLDAAVMDSLYDDPTFHSLPYTKDGLPSSEMLSVDAFPLLTVDYLPALSGPPPLDTADVWGTILCSTSLVQLPTVFSSQVGCWNAEHACNPPGDMLGAVSSGLSTVPLIA